jgi:tripeptide aminopeptidase
MVNGGRASNIVCDRINALAEARSIAPEKLKAQTEHMEKCLREASDKFGARLIINISREYNGFKISENEPVLELFKKATETAGLEFVKEASGGGSDTNIFNASGLKALNIAIGMDKVHTTDERIAVKDLSDTSRLLAAIIAQASIQNNPEVSE